MTKTIQQSVRLPATPDDLYDGYLDAQQHAAITGGKVSISGREGGKFSAFGGMLQADLALMQCWVFLQQLKSRSEIDRGNVAARRDDRARQEQVNLRRRGLGYVSVL